MNQADSTTILARAGLWATELRERGQLDNAAAAARLNETLAESLGERLDRQDDPILVVMLCGPTAAGKSSLINALAGADVSRPGHGATTRAAVLYVHELDDPARLFEYSQALGSSAQQETELVRHSRNELLHKVLVDTPDIDSVMLQHKELTARLVHAADLVLFVTSPEKYKVMRSARWILQQRQQRAMAFLLNKWDRQALGLQRDRRHELEDDFRNVLAGEGFPNAVVFKVSALATSSTGTEPDGIDNELPALRAWLETGITRSTAMVIRQRRLRAAWGRLAAAIEHAVPVPLSSYPLLPKLTERLAGSGGMAEQRVSAEASILEAAGLEDSGWPSTPGLLGMWTRTRHRIASTAASLQTGLSVFNLGARAGRAGIGTSHQPMSGNAFGGRGVAVLSETIGQLIGEASAARMALGPVGTAWSAETSRLEHELAPLPLDAVAELVAQANRPTLRRFLGITSIYAVEAVIVAVLLIAVVRVGMDFVAGSYAPTALFITAMELVFVLVVIGHIIANVFFPPLRQRLRRMVAQRARSLVKAAVDSAQVAMKDHVEAVDRLAREGRDLLLRIDRTVIALTKETGEEESVDRLFGQQPQLRLSAESTVSLSAPEGQELARRRPSFD